MKNFLLVLLLSMTAHAGFETGTPDQVLRVPHAGGRPIYGTVDLTKTAAVTGALPVGNGGTGLTAPGASGNVLTSNGTGWVSSLPSPTLFAPWVQLFTSGSGTYRLTYVFVTASANATAAATYTNNGQTFTVAKTISGATVLYAQGTGIPATSGTLTRTSGSGDLTISFIGFKSPVAIRARLVGAGGGGGGSPGTDGTAGGDTTFGSLTAGGGQGGLGGGLQGGAGGVCTSSGSPAPLAVAGSRGATGNYGSFPSGGSGGASALGGSGGGGNGASGNNSTPGVDGTGGGGGGGGGISSTSVGSGGGGSGCSIDAIIPSPSLSYSYAIGAGGAPGTGGGTFRDGSIGGAGSATITEDYQ